MVIKFLLILLLAFGSVLAQAEPDSTQTVKSDEMIFKMSKDPWGAVLRSAVLPGWGQYYNEAYWKIPIFIGAIGSLAYVYSWYDDRFDEYRGKYSDALKDESTLASSYLRSREFYRDNRDQIAVYIGLAYFLNLLDAFVDAHLFDFDVSENMDIGTMNLNVRIKL